MKTEYRKLSQEATCTEELRALIQAVHQRPRERTSPMVNLVFDSQAGIPSTVRDIKIKEYPEMTDQPKINSQADALASYHITDEMLSKCELIQNASTGKYFVLVESANEQGTIYRVEYDREKKCLRCLPHTGTPCKAQEAGNGCWHKRAACATFALFRLEQRQRRQAEAAAVEETAEYREEHAIVDLEWALEEARTAKREAAAVRKHGRNAYSPTEIRRDEKYGIILR